MCSLDCDVVFVDKNFVVIVRRCVISVSYVVYSEEINWICCFDVFKEYCKIFFMILK